MPLTQHNDPEPYARGGHRSIYGLRGNVINITPSRKDFAVQFLEADDLCSRGLGDRTVPDGMTCVTSWLDPTHCRIIIPNGNAPTHTAADSIE